MPLRNAWRHVYIGILKHLVCMMSFLSKKVVRLLILKFMFYIWLLYFNDIKNGALLYRFILNMKNLWTRPKPTLSSSHFIWGSLTLSSLPSPLKDMSILPQPSLPKSFLYPHLDSYPIKFLSYVHVHLNILICYFYL